MRGHYWSLMKRGMYMDIKLFDSELKVMDVIWREGDTPAKEIARQLTNDLGWNINTTYTLIKDYSFSRGTLDSLKHNRNISTATLNDLCNILSCRVEDVLVHTPDEA